jgi:hypothetical protein
VSAQSGFIAGNDGPSISYSGALDLEYLNDNNGPGRIGHLNANLGYGLQTSGNIDVGVDLDVFAYAIKEDHYTDSKLILNPSITANSRWGKTFVGQPRDARRSLFDVMDAKPSTHMEITYKFGLMPRSYIEVAPFFNQRTVGIRHDFGNDRYQASLSYHNVESDAGSSLNVGYLAGKYRLNAHISLITSAEVSNGASFDAFGSKFRNNLEIGTIATLGNLEGRILYSSGLHSGRIDNWHASARYAFNDHLSGNLYYSTLDIAEYNITSVGLEYDLREDISLSASATNVGSTIDPNRTFAFGVGLNF